MIFLSKRVLFPFMFFFLCQYNVIDEKLFFFVHFSIIFHWGIYWKNDLKINYSFLDKKGCANNKKFVHQKFICLQDCWKLKPNNIKNSLLLILTFPLILTNPPNVPPKKISKGIHFTFLRLNKVLCWMNVYKHNNCNGIAETFSFFRALDNN